MCRTPFALSLIALAALASAQKATAPKFGNEQAITPKRLKAHLELIANDLLEGRDTPSRGLDFATLYVSTQLKLWGAQPAGDDGTFFQTISFSQTLLDTNKSKIEFGGTTYTFGDGIKGTNKGIQGSGKLVYVGHGLMVKKKNVDPYAGLDVKGKILVVAGGSPKWLASGDIAGTPGVDYGYPIQMAEKLGAIGVIVIPDQRYLSTWSPFFGSRISGLTFGLDRPRVDPVAMVNVGPSLARAIFQGEAMSADDALKGADAPEKSFALSDSKTMNLDVEEKRDIQTARNVVAIVPGTDPKLKSEYVAFGAHIDHVGMLPGDGPGDRIFNGADDDGSGTVSILEIAHAFLTGPKPKRSLLFVWHIGEEKGLWGSSWYTDHPTVNLKNVITQLNIDMIGRSKKPGDTNPANSVLTGPNEIYVVGSTKMSTDLQKLSESVNKGFLKLSFNYKYDDPKDPEQIFYRSDHYNYARKGIPIMFYFDGVHEDYHQVGDEVSKIDFTKMSKVARTVYATGWTLANGAKRPVVDKPLKG